MSIVPPPYFSNAKNLDGLNAHVNQFAAIGYISRPDLI